MLGSRYGAVDIVDRERFSTIVAGRILENEGSRISGEIHLVFSF